MANMNQEEARARRQRQYEIDRITARYEEEFRAGKAPRLEEYLQRYPAYAQELKEFVLYFHSIATDLPEPDSIPAADLSPAAEQVLAQIIIPAPPSPTSVSSPAVESVPAQTPSPPPKPNIEPLTSLVRSGLAAGYPPPRLAEALGISRDVLAKLEARAIAASSIPRSFVQRAADTLHLASEAVMAYFQGTSPAQADAFFYADKAPTQAQESFLEAIQASPQLADNQKREWAEIIARDLPGA